MSDRVWSVVNYSLSALVLLSCMALGVTAIQTCSTVREAQRLEDMSEPEVELFAARLAAQVAAIAEALVAEGDLDPAHVQTIANALEGIATGTAAPAVGGLAGALEVDGYGAAALTLAVIELDAELTRRGALEPGGAVSPRARLVLSAVAARLSQVVTPE